MTIWLTLPVLALAALLSAAPQARAQAHVQHSGSYTLRSSTTNSENLDPDTARKHGVIRSPRHAVLNILVQEHEKTVPAKVAATLQNLTGQQRQVDLREISTNGYVSYIGSYDFARGEVIDFTITAIPAGTQQKLTLKYRERMWPEGAATSR